MGTGEKRHTLILDPGGTTPQAGSGPVSPRNALPPPPHIRRSGVPDAEMMKDLDAGWESVRPGSNRPGSNRPGSEQPTKSTDRPSPLSALIHGARRPQTEPVAKPRTTTEPIPASARQPSSTLAPTSFARRSQLPPVLVRSSSNVPLSRSPASPPPSVGRKLSTPISLKPALVPPERSDATPVSLRPALVAAGLAPASVPPISLKPAPLFFASQLPPPPSSRRMFAPEIEEISSSELLELDDRPSDRKTVPNELKPKNEVELSASDLESDPSLITTRPPPPSRESANMYQPSLAELAGALETPSKLPRLSLPDPDEAYTPSSLPPVSMDARPALTSQPSNSAHSLPVPQMSRQWLAIFAASHVAVAASVLFWVYATRAEPKPHPREPHIALEQRTSMESTAGAVIENVTPADGCRVQDLSRVIAARAELGPALDAAALDSGFGVGLVSKPHEATGIRLEASTLRTAETVKVRSTWPVTRVAVDKGDTEEDRLEVRVDGNDTKTLETQKITAHKGGVFTTDASGNPQLLWALHGVAPKSETVRAVSRSDGSALVAVRRTGVMWIGVTGQGAIVPVLRDKKTLGTPTLAPMPAGGMVAWAERDPSSPFSVLVARVDVDGKHTIVGEPEAIAEGISPALATLPSGELLLAYSDGKAGAHRVVAQRLAPDLTPRGDLLVLSSPGLNAGQPAIAVDAEGRAIVAYLAIENGRAEVHATSLSCR